MSINAVTLVLLIALSLVASVISKTSLTPSEIKKLLDAHNMYRRQTSPPASNMRLLTWDDTLATKGQEKADKCVYRHGGKFYTKKFGQIGENLYVTSAKIPNEFFGVEEAVKMWNAEKEFFSYDRNFCEARHVCHHYTQVVWATSYKVGCGMKYCPGDVAVPGRVLKGATLIFCEYGPAGNTAMGFLFDKSVALPFSRGQPCSACPQDARICRKNLCLTQEEAAITTTTTTTTTKTTTTTTPTTPTTTPMPTTTIPTTTTSTTAYITTTSSAFKSTQTVMPATPPAVANVSLATRWQTSATEPSVLAGNTTKLISNPAVFSTQPITANTTMRIDDKHTTTTIISLTTTSPSTTKTKTTVTTTTAKKPLVCYRCKTTSKQKCQKKLKKIKCRPKHNACIGLDKPNKYELGCTSLNICEKRKSLVMMTPTKIECCTESLCNFHKGKSYGPGGFAVAIKPGPTTTLAVVVLFLCRFLESF